MTQPAIVFDKVSKNYTLYHQFKGGLKNFLLHFSSGVKSLRNSTFLALHDVSFEVFKGETLGIIGRNGAGKSTTLGLIAGVMKPTAGQIAVRGRISPLLELGAGFSHELTGRENIVLNGVLMGLNRADVTEKMSQIIEFSELEDFIDQPLRVYSSGMIGRLGFSVAAHLDPEILLVDEVLSVGDDRFQKKCLAKMAEFQQKQVTIVFVSHSVESVSKLCSRVMWLDKHTVRMLGDTQEVIREYTKTG
jgi:lipopolysaccharide transport system ATP-binding protein